MGGLYTEVQRPFADTLYCSMLLVFRILSQMTLVLTERWRNVVAEASSRHIMKEV